MKQYKVIKEFPGLKVGDILTEDTGTGFFVNEKDEFEVGEGVESMYVNTVAINKAAIEENIGEYFEEIISEELDEPLTPKQARINDMMQVAAYLEADFTKSLPFRITR